MIVSDIVEVWSSCQKSTQKVPKNEHCSGEALLGDHHFVMRHILVPREGGGGHFRSLVDRRVVLSGETLTVTSSLPDRDAEDDVTVNVLFTETVYDDVMRKFNLVCLDRPIRDPAYDGDAFAGLFFNRSDLSQACF